MIIVRIVRIKRAVRTSPNMFHLQIMWKLGTLITQQFFFFCATRNFLQNFDKNIFLQFLLLRHWYGWIEDIVTWNRKLMKIGQKFIVTDHFLLLTCSWPFLVSLWRNLSKIFALQKFLEKFLYFQILVRVSENSVFVLSVFWLWMKSVEYL